MKIHQQLAKIKTKDITYMAFLQEIDENPLLVSFDLYHAGRVNCRRNQDKF